MDIGEQADVKDKVERAAIWSDAENELLVDTVTGNEHVSVSTSVRLWGPP